MSGLAGLHTSARAVCNKMDLTCVEHMAVVVSVGTKADALVFKGVVSDVPWIGLV